VYRNTLILVLYTNTHIVQHRYKRTTRQVHRWTCGRPKYTYAHTYLKGLNSKPQAGPISLHLCPKCMCTHSCIYIYRYTKYICARLYECDARSVYVVYVLLLSGKYKSLPHACSSVRWSRCLHRLNGSRLRAYIGRWTGNGRFCFVSCGELKPICTYVVLRSLAANGYRRHSLETLRRWLIVSRNTQGLYYAHVFRTFV
jgi:hypothetical protein